MISHSKSFRAVSFVPNVSVSKYPSLVLTVILHCSSTTISRHKNKCGTQFPLISCSQDYGTTRLPNDMFIFTTVLCFEGF